MREVHLYVPLSVVTAESSLILNNVMQETKMDAIPSAQTD